MSLTESISLGEIAQFGIAAIATAILAWAAVSDVRSRRIPNWCVAALLGLYLPWAVIGGWPDALSGLEAAAIGLAVTFALYAFGILGAGDSKLFGACALFAGMGFLPYLAVATSLVGGLVALVSIASRPTRALVMVTMRGKGDFGRGIPYGVAVAAAAAIVIWAPLAGLLHPYAYGGRPIVTTHDVTRALASHQRRPVP
jgi:prepilin peptidase CpaA